MAPSSLSVHAVAHRETTHRGSAIAEARRSSPSTCLSRSVRVMSRVGQFGSGLSSRWSHGATGWASSEEVADRRAQRTGPPPTPHRGTPPTPSAPHKHQRADAVEAARAAVKAAATTGEAGTARTDYAAKECSLISLWPALPMINQSSGSHVGGLKLHSGVLTRRILPGPCGKRSTRDPV